TGATRSVPRIFGDLTVAGRAQPASSRAPSRRSRTRSGRRIAPGLPRLPFPLEAAPELGLAPGPVPYLALELAAGGVDVVATGAANHGQHLRIEQDLLEGADGRLVRPLVAGAREGIERDQVDLARIARLHRVVELAHQLRQLAGMLGLVV